MKNKKILFSFILILIITMGCAKKNKHNNEELITSHSELALEANKDIFESNEDIVPFEINSSNQDNILNIKRCAFSKEENNQCQIQEAPLIGMENQEITIDTIMSRVLTSQKSYALTFKEILATLPPEILQMFGAVNAIVLSERINPSFYHPMTGAIYLSSQYIWRTNEEKKIFSKVDDRSNYGKKLQFEYNLRSHLNGSNIWKNFWNKTRNLEEIKYPLYSLIIHELSHANDFFPKSFYQLKDINLTRTYLEVANERWDKDEILRFRLPYYQYSKALKKIGQVLNAGAQEDDDDLALSAEKALELFLNDPVSDEYAYSTTGEDFAMLVENSLMLHFYNVYSVAYITKFPHANFTPPENYEDQIVGGIINKIAQEEVKPRALKAIQDIFSIEFATKVKDNLDQVSPTSIPYGIKVEQLDQL